MGEENLEVILRIPFSRAIWKFRFSTKSFSIGSNRIGREDTGAPSFK